MLYQYIIVNIYIYIRTLTIKVIYFTRLFGPLKV